jgi:hypothetical protein
MSRDYIMNLLKLGPGTSAVHSQQSTIHSPSLLWSSRSNYDMALIDRVPDPPVPVAEFDVKDWTNAEIHLMLKKWNVQRNFPVDIRVWHAKLGVDTQL